MALSSPHRDGTAELLLHWDDAGVPRGSLDTCPCYQPPVPRPLTFDLHRSEAKAAACGTSCTECGHDSTEHSNLTAWYQAGLRWLRRVGQRKPHGPRCRGFPARAQYWEPQAAVLWMFAGGLCFDLGDPAEQEGEYHEERYYGDPHLVSAVCVTCQGRHAFHPLLYENFRRQSCVEKELVVIDSGAEPSAFMLERKAEDARVFYYFFKASDGHFEPGSPRLQDESGMDEMAPVFGVDDPMECTEWTRKRPFATEVKKDGWTKGFKRNLACMMARGSTLVNMEDGCLYSEDYLAAMQQKLERKVDAAVALQGWYTVSLVQQSFRWVDLQRNENLEIPSSLDRLSHGFSHAYTRAAWLKQPFPDKEGPQDLRFMEGLQGQSIEVLLPIAPPPLAAYGWYLHSRPSPGKDAPSTINLFSELLIVASRGDDTKTAPPQLAELLPVVQAAVEVFRFKGENRLKQMLEKEGTIYVCSSCDCAVALQKHWRDTSRHTNPYGCTFDIGQFSRAGGAVAEGREYDDGTSWFPGWIWRMAICRSCGTHIGWRFESRSWNRSGGRGDAKLFWGLIWRHLRQHGTGVANQRLTSQQLWCPKEHPLRRYATPHEHYVCDVCNRKVKPGEHLWGCGACDYDMCDGCKAKAVHTKPQLHASQAAGQGVATAANDSKSFAAMSEMMRLALPILLKPLFPEAQWRGSYAMYWP